MSVCCEYCVLSGRGLCDELITRPEESYRLWCVVVCVLEENNPHEWECQGPLGGYRTKRERKKRSPYMKTRRIIRSSLNIVCSVFREMPIYNLSFLISMWRQLPLPSYASISVYSPAVAVCSTYATWSMSAFWLDNAFLSFVWFWR